MDAGKTYENWQYSFVQGLFWEKGIVNNTIFLSYLNEVLPKREKINRKVVVGTTDALTGDFIRYDEKLDAHTLIYKAGRASTSIPGFFEYVEFDNRTLIDGGVVINLDIGGAIHRCKKAGYADKDIIVDIIMTSGDKLPDANVSDFNSAQMLYRYWQISQFQKTMIWISQGIAHFPLVDFRYIVFPEEKLDKGVIPVDFSNKNMNRMIDIGIKQGHETVEKGATHSLESLQATWFNSNINPFHVEEFDDEDEVEPKSIEELLKASE